MRLLLVEDSRLLRERLRAMIRAVPGCEVVAEADTETDARSRLDQQRPDVIVLDLRLRGGSGLSVLDYVKARQPDVIVIVLTNYGDAEYRARCLDLGADYFFDKSRDIETFLGVLGELQLRLFAPAEQADGAMRTAAGAAEEREAT